MGDTTINAHITCEVVKFGNADVITLPEGATYADVPGAVEDGENLDISSGGTDVRKAPETPVQEGQKFAANPSSVKQG